MEESLEQTGGDPREIDDEVAEFLSRFPEDPRSVEVRSYADELELQRLARRLRVQSRLRGDAATHPAEQIYADAVALVDADPSQAATMLTDLLALYPPAEVADDVVRPYLVLAERQLDKLQQTLKQRAGEQLPRLVERLASAKRLEVNAPQRAAAMYEALVRLYADEPWAAHVVEQAKRRLDELGVDKSLHEQTAEK